MAPAPISVGDLLRSALPVWPSVKEAYRFTFANLGSLFAISWKWLVLVLLPAMVLYLWYSYPAIEATYRGLATGKPEPLPPELHFKMMFAGLLYTLAQIVPMASIAVNWHRFILRNEPATSANGLRLDAPVMRYLGIAAGFTAIMVLPSIIQMFFIGNPSGLAIAVVIISGLAVIGVAILLLRLSMMLPGVAVENPNAQLSNVMAATRGHTLRLLGGYLLIVLPAILLSILTLIAAMVFGTNGAVAMQGVSVLVYLVLTAVVLTFMSIAYRFFYENKAGAVA